MQFCFTLPLSSHISIPVKLIGNEFNLIAQIGGGLVKSK